MPGELGQPVHFDEGEMDRLVDEFVERRLLLEDFLSEFPPARHSAAPLPLLTNSSFSVGERFGETSGQRAVGFTDF